MTNKTEANCKTELCRLLRASPKIMQVLNAARKAKLPDWRLFSGAIYQTVWNDLTGRAVDFGIRDYDLAYFDNDLSDTAEIAFQERVLVNIPDLVRQQVDIANQARVHLWFEEEFGRPYQKLGSTDEALERSLFTAHAVGVRLENDNSISIAAPFGLGDIFNMILRPNSRFPIVGAHTEKGHEAHMRWPEIEVDF